MANNINTRPNEHLTNGIIVVLTLVVIAMDLILPADVAVATLYGVVVLMTLRSNQLSHTSWVAALSVWFTIAGVFFSPMLSNAIIINGVLAIAIIVTTGFLVFKQKAADDRIHTLNILSTTDSLTLVKNRLAFNEIIPIEIVRAKRYNRSLSMAILDVDNFAQINEKYGHDYADKFLKQLVLKVKSMVRHSDCLFRLGGDKFAIVFVETDMSQVVLVVEDICKKVANLTLTNKKIAATISIGVDTCESTDSIDTLLIRTTKALNKSKANGGNCVTTIEDINIDLVRAG